MIHIVSIITVDRTEDEVLAVAAIRDAVSQINFGRDGLVVLTASQGHDNIGAMATRTLEGLAQHHNRSLVIRLDKNFRPYIMDYPQGEGRPYDVNVNVSEVVGMYEDSLK